MAATAVSAAYPIQLEVDYPERQLRRKALLLLPLAIPVLTSRAARASRPTASDAQSFTLAPNGKPSHVVVARMHSM
jgi:hypothetical protein